jgi:uncharacterized membrane protein (DUF485 family)
MMRRVVIAESGNRQPKLRNQYAKKNKLTEFLTVIILLLLLLFLLFSSSSSVFRSDRVSSTKSRGVGVVAAISS